MPRRKKAEEPVEPMTDNAPDTEDTQILNSADIESEEADLLADEAETPEENLESEDDDNEVAELKAVEEKPKRARRSRKKPEPVAESTPTTSNDFAARNMEEMIKQWNTIKEISTTITQNFEKINGMLPKLPTNYVETGEIFRPQVPKVPFIMKFATGASLVATLLSVLSLSLSQSARNSVINEQLAMRQSQTQTPFAAPTPQIAANPHSRRRDPFFKTKK